MISLSQVGISQVPITLLQSHTTETTLEESEPLLDYDATLMDDPFELFNPTTSIELKGFGPLPVALSLVGSNGGLVATHAALSGGKTIIKRNKYSQEAKAHDQFEASAMHYPNAAA
jgi:hypothetical protein